MNYLEVLEKLVSFNTVNDLENSKIMDYIGNYLKEIGFDIQYVYNKEKSKKCLIAKIGNPNLLFVGHTDTVNYNNWNYDPFKLTVVGDKLYGLGTCDMKGGIAAFLCALKETNFNDLTYGVQLVLTFDEETGFGGIDLVKDLQNDWPNNVIVGEPTSLIPVNCTKGMLEYKASFEGISAHSSRLTSGKNAIVLCNSFINELLEFSEELKSITNDSFEIPYTTMNIAKINGGRAMNIVPDACELCFEFRTIGKDVQKLIHERVFALAKKHQVKIDEFTNMYPLENNSDISFYEEITGNKKKSFNYLTEASVINKDNVVILGVGPNNEHIKDEFINYDLYIKTIEVYKKAINYYCKK